MPAGFRIKFISKHKTGVSHTIQENQKKNTKFYYKEKLTKRIKTNLRISLEYIYKGNSWSLRIMKIREKDKRESEKEEWTTKEKDLKQIEIDRKERVLAKGYNK